MNLLLQMLVKMLSVDQTQNVLLLDIQVNANVKQGILGMPWEIKVVDCVKFHALVKLIVLVIIIATKEYAKVNKMF